MTYQPWMAVEPIYDEDPRLDHPKCGRWMVLAQEPCYRWPGHKRECRTQFAVEYSRDLHRRRYRAKHRESAA